MASRSHSSSSGIVVISVVARLALAIALVPLGLRYLLQ
jgi:hypothetical protein